MTNKNDNVMVRYGKFSTSMYVGDESSEGLSGGFESKDDIAKGTDYIEQVDLLVNNLVSLCLNYSKYNYNGNN